MLGWACHETGGGMNTALVLRGNTISASKYGWAFMSALNVCHLVLLRVSLELMMR